MKKTLMGLVLAGSMLPAIAQVPMPLTRNLNVTIEKSPDDAKVSAYRVYVGTEPKNYYGYLDIPNTTNSTLSATLQVPSGTHLYVSTTAVNDYMESEFSNEMDIVEPPGGQITGLVPRGAGKANIIYTIQTPEAGKNWYLMTKTNLASPWKFWLPKTPLRLGTNTTFLAQPVTGDNFFTLWYGR